MVPKIVETPEVGTPMISKIEMGPELPVKALTSNIMSEEHTATSEQPLYIAQAAQHAWDLILICMLVNVRETAW